MNRLVLLLEFFDYIILKLAQLCNHKKNAEHTRMYTIFRNFITQYSRRLLSILAHHKKQNKPKKIVVCFSAILVLFWEFHWCFKLNLIKKRSEKKCGAHTHAHHLSRTLFSIFTLVVVYSRTKLKKKKTKNHAVRLPLPLNLTTASRSIHKHYLNNSFFRKGVLRSSQRNDDHVVMRFAR